jgi:hypothetical protein
MCWRNYFRPILLQCTENSTSVPINFSVTKNFLQSRSTSMYRKFDFSSNRIQCAEEISTVTIHFNVAKTWFLSQIFQRTFYADLHPFSLALSPLLLQAINSDLPPFFPCEVTELYFTKPFHCLSSHNCDCVSLAVCFVTFRLILVPSKRLESTNAALHFRLYGTSAVPLGQPQTWTNFSTLCNIQFTNWPTDTSPFTRRSVTSAGLSNFNGRYGFLNQFC